MKKIFILGLLLTTISALAEPVTTITNRKTGEQLQVNCSDEECSYLKFTLHRGAEVEEIATFDKNEYQAKVNKIAEIDTQWKKDNTFGLTKGLGELPWDNELFVIAYFLFLPISLPLTAAAVAIDVAILPISLALGIEPNLGRKLARKISKKKDASLRNNRFEKLVKQLREV